MVFRHFRFIISLRIFLLAANGLLFSFFILKTVHYAVIGVSGLVFVYQIYSLIRYVEKTNRDLNRFLDAIRYDDFSQSFSGLSLGASFDELRKAFNDVLEKFKRTRSEKEEHFRYLHTVVQHVGIGLITFQPNGDVQLINTAAKRLLKVNRLRNIEQLSSLSQDLGTRLKKMKSGEKALVKVSDEDSALQLTISATEFRMQGQQFTLVSLQNIQSELEEKEMDAWQNLIRVLTHEIMNSVTPISSLASTVNCLLSDSPQLTGETIDDVRSAAQTIEKRSNGLLHFVESYRKLTRIPRPNFQIFGVAALIGRVEKLMSSHVAETNIAVTSGVEPRHLEITADPELIEQVLINLLLNAIESVKGQSAPQIELMARIDARGRAIIQVADNGPGIAPDLLDKIFVPFFTTKKDGSGIGLSLSRQIMRLHRGAISASSNPGIRTVFTLRF
ncbi:MAG: sensor histidine kinase [Candidatus Zhuqueibacterota bacterium]